MSVCAAEEATDTFDIVATMSRCHAGCLLGAVLLALQLFVPVAPAASVPTASARTSAENAARLLPEGIDWKAVVGPPPAPDSCDAVADLAVVKFEQARRSPAEIDNAWRGVALDAVTFDQALNSRLDAEVAPKLSALLRSAIAQVRAVNSVLKKEYDRLRPFDADPSITPVVPREEGRSYPSSHAMRGLLVARLLADIFPERRNDLIDFGRQVGYSRVVGGVHYPSDVEAGFRLAERASAEIVQTAAWRAAVRDASDEVAVIRAAMVPPAGERR